MNENFFTYVLQCVVCDEQLTALEAPDHQEAHVAAGELPK